MKDGFQDLTREPSDPRADTLGPAGVNLQGPHVNRLSMGSAMPFRRQRSRWPEKTTRLIKKETSDSPIIGCKSNDHGVNTRSSEWESMGFSFYLPQGRIGAGKRQELYKKNRSGSLHLREKQLSISALMLRSRACARVRLRARL